MGFVILVVVGGILGWLASIVTRSEDRQGLLLNAGVGIASALLVGIATNSGSILLGISAMSLFASFVGAVVVLVVANVLRNRAMS